MNKSLVLRAMLRLLDPLTKHFLNLAACFPNKNLDKTPIIVVENGFKEPSGNATKIKLSMPY